MPLQLGSKPAAQPPVNPNPAYPPAQGFTAEGGAISIGAAMQYAQDQLGGPLVENETNPASSATPSVAIDGNGERVALIMVNNGANDIFVAVSAAVGASFGVRLGANGGNVTMNVRDDWTLPTRRWWMVSPSGASNLYIVELYRYGLAPKAK